jgi:hypothetical protein
MARLARNAWWRLRAFWFDASRTETVVVCASCGETERQHPNRRCETFVEVG